MTLLAITIRFRSKQEQKYVEDNCGFDYYEHETFENVQFVNYCCQTDFEIRGCKASDLLIFDKLLNEYKED